VNSDNELEEFADFEELVYAFHGRRVDEETNGLMYFRNRYYNPKLGRFIQRDPLLYVDSYGLYQAFGCNPYQFRDPSGKVILNPITWEPVEDRHLDQSTAFVVTHGSSTFDGNRTTEYPIRWAFSRIRKKYHPFFIYHLFSCNSNPGLCENHPGPCPGNDHGNYLDVRQGENRVPSHDGPLHNEGDLGNLPNTVVSLGGNFDQCQKRTLREIAKSMQNNKKSNFNIVLPVDLIYDTKNTIDDIDGPSNNRDSTYLWERLINMDLTEQRNYLSRYFYSLFNGTDRNQWRWSSFSEELERRKG